MRAVLELVDMGTGPQNSVGQLKPRPSRAPAPLRNRIGANFGRGKQRVEANINLRQDCLRLGF